MPIAAVPCEPGGFEAEHGADITGADVGDETLKAGTFNEAGPRPSQVVIDDHDVLKAEGLRLRGERILPLLTLHVVQDLPGGGLAHVDERAAAEVVSGERRVHRHLRRVSLTVRGRP